MIPEMTDPLGRHWKQPNKDDIKLEDGHALMTETTFNQLADYSSTIPNGVYPGKMWKRHDGAYDHTVKIEDVRWLLCWYGSETRGKCQVHFSPIWIVGS